MSLIGALVTPEQEPLGSRDVGVHQGPSPTTGARQWPHRGQDSLDEAPSEVPVGRVCGAAGGDGLLPAFHATVVIHAHVVLP